MIDPTRQRDRLPHRRLRIIAPPAYQPVHVPWWKIKKSTVTGLAWFALYSMGASLILAAITYGSDLLAYAIHGR